MKMGVKGDLVRISQKVIGLVYIALFQLRGQFSSIENRGRIEAEWTKLLIITYQSHSYKKYLLEAPDSIPGGPGLNA